MKFSDKRDIEAPAAFVFGYLTDFDAWERSAMRRGADIERTDEMPIPMVGSSWRARFPYRGKTRVVDAKVTKMTAPSKLNLTAQSPAIEAEISVDLVEMSVRRTRMHVILDVTPRNLTARLFMQSLRLARARMDRKYAFRVAQTVSDIETAYRAAQGV